MRKCFGLVLFFTGALLLLGQEPASRGLTFERLRNAGAEPQNWLMYKMCFPLVIS